MRDALRSYLQIAGGLADLTRQRATAAAQALVERASADLGEAGHQAQAVPQYVQQLADELLAAGRANRDMLVSLVRSEVDKAVQLLKPAGEEGGADEERIQRLENRVTELERRLAHLSGARPATGRRVPKVEPVPKPATAEPEPEAPVPPAPAAKTPARKAPAKKAPARKAAEKRAAEAPGAKLPPKKAAATGGAGKTTAEKTTAVHAAARKAAAKKATGTASGAGQSAGGAAG